MSEDAEHVGAIKQQLDLPGTFEQWPREDQLEYLEHTGSKERLVEAAVDSIGADIDPGLSSAGLKKGEWAEILVALMEDGHAE